MEKLKKKIFYEKSHIFLKQDNLSDNSTAFCRKDEAFSRSFIYFVIQNGTKCSEESRVHPRNN